MKTKTRLLVGLAAMALLLTACIPSVYPFYLEKDLVPYGKLLGEWQPAAPGDITSWKFEEGEQNGAKVLLLTFTEKDGKKGVMLAHFFKLEDGHFLDISPKDCEFASGQVDLIGAAMVPGHLLIGISQLEPTIKLGFFDMDWLAKYLEKNPKSLAHHAENDRVILTASTADLQRFVLKHKRELFGKETELAKKPIKASETTK